MLKKLFGFGKTSEKNQPASTASNQYAPGTQLPYDPALISRFEGHHQSLFKIIANIDKSIESQNFNQLKTRLVTLRGALQEHLLEENLKLYVYLSRCLSRDPINVRLVEGMKAEMNQIAGNVMGFLNSSIEGHIGADNVDAFASNFEGMKKVLAERVRREEESLYTLYMPPDSY